MYVRYLPIQTNPKSHRRTCLIQTKRKNHRTGVDQPSSLQPIRLKTGHLNTKPVPIQVILEASPSAVSWTTLHCNRGTAMRQTSFPTRSTWKRGQTKDTLVEVHATA